MDKIKMIGRGRNGWHASGISSLGHKFSSSGGTLEGYLADAQDETPIYDAEEADYASFASFTISGPMCDTFLEPGQIKRFDDNSKTSLARMLPGLEGAFKTIGANALRNDLILGSFDFIATDLYLHLLKAKVPGVKIGRVRNHRIVWLGLKGEAVNES